MDTFCNIFGLNQVVDHPTHFHNGLCHSLIDLVFMSNLSYLSNCQVISPLSNSDHLGIKIKVKTKQTFRLKVPQAQRKICRYSFADWNRACELLESYPWESLVDEDINVYWFRWVNVFLEIVEQTIPTASLSARSNLPWLTKDIKKAMKKRDILFKKKAYSLEYRRARNKVVGMVRKAKCNYFKRLDPKHTNKTVKYLTKNQANIPTLVNNDVVSTTDYQKADTLNLFFSSCFNSSHSPLEEKSEHAMHGSTDLDDVYCTVEEITQLFSSGESKWP